MEQYENDVLASLLQSPVEQVQMPTQDQEPESQLPQPESNIPVQETPPEHADEYIEQPQRYMPDARPPKTGEKKPVFRTILCCVLVLALVAAGCVVTALCMHAHWDKQLQSQAASQQAQIDELRQQLKTPSNVENTTIVLPDGQPVEGDLTAAQVYSMNVDAVVAISNQGITTNIFGQVSQTASSGSGFIISADGYVVSNYHVVEGATTLRVITSDGTEHDAKLVGYDAANDLSVLKIESTELPYVHFGSSDALVVGSPVAAIGNPLGELTSTLTMGYISAKDRMVNTDGISLNMIQTDAAINSGNSGGPLFNMRGEVIGITTAKYSGTSNSGATIEGIGFAIPIDDVQDLIDDIIRFGRVKTGYMGVVVQDVPAEDAQKYGLPLGALILEVTPDGCAERAGLRAGDIIVDIDGNAVGSVADLTRALRQYEAGMEAQVTVYRAGSSVTVTAVFDEKPLDPTVEQEPTQPQTMDPSSGFGGFWPFIP